MTSTEDLKRAAAAMAEKHLTVARKSFAKEAHEKGIPVEVGVSAFVFCCGRTIVNSFSFLEKVR